jgi:hypothetical protein
MTPRRRAGHWPQEKFLDLHLRVSGRLRGGGAPGSAKVQERGTLKPQTHLCKRKTLLTAARKARLQRLWRHNPMPRWPNQVRAWIGPFPLRPWICGWRKLALTYKKCCTPPNRTAPTWPNKEPMA